MSGDRHRLSVQLLRPVMATVTPTPIMARPPAPPTISNRGGERANQLLTTLAANPQAQYAAPAILTTRTTAAEPCRIVPRPTAPPPPPTQFPPACPSAR